MVRKDLAWLCQCCCCGAAGRMRCPCGCRDPSVGMSGTRAACPRSTALPSVPQQGPNPRAAPWPLTSRCAGSYQAPVLAASCRSAAQGGNQPPSSSTALLPTARGMAGAWPAASKESFHSRRVFCHSQQALGRHRWYSSILARARGTGVGWRQQEQRGALGRCCSPARTTCSCCPSTPGPAAQHSMAQHGEVWARASGSTGHGDTAGHPPAW